MKEGHDVIWRHVGSDRSTVVCKEFAFCEGEKYLDTDVASVAEVNARQYGILRCDLRNTSPTKPLAFYANIAKGRLAL